MKKLRTSQGLKSVQLGDPGLSIFTDESAVDNKTVQSWMACCWWPFRFAVRNSPREAPFHPSGTFPDGFIALETIEGSANKEQFLRARVLCTPIAGFSGPRYKL